jgi:predicted ATP-dependent endonuclease of OLD family
MTPFDDLIQKKQQRFDFATGAASRIKQDISFERNRNTAALEEQKVVTQAIEIFVNLSGRFESQFIGTVQAVVQRGLQSVFGPGIDFNIERGMYGKQPTMNFKIVTKDSGEQDLIDSHGGGLVTLAGLIVRVVVVRLLKHSQAQILFLDEPLAMLSAQYREPAAQLLRDLANDLGMQIVMVTHHDEFSEYADTVVRLSRSSSGTVALLDKTEK